MAAPQTTDHILYALTSLFDAETVVELRVLEYEDHGYTSTRAGYYNDFSRLAQAAVKLTPRAKGVYVTLNPVDPTLLARCANRTKRAKSGEATPDTKILHRHWFPLDFDPVRDSHISSTDAERELAQSRARACQEFLQQCDWPEPLVGDSGNGEHLLYAIDLPNDEASKVLIENCLKALELLFRDDQVKVDTTVFNAARIWKLYGTWARKGDNVPDRPHRQARILSRPETFEVVPVEKLQTLAALIPEPEAKPTQPHRMSQSTFDVEVFMAAHGMTGKRGAWGSKGEKWRLDVCPFNPDHTDKSAVVVRFDDGRLGFRCHHNGCLGRRWGDVRDLFEPDRPRQKAQGQSQARDQSETAHQLKATTARHDPQQESNPWEHAISATAFIQQNDETYDSIVGELIYRGSITILSSPRGTGKSMMALALAVAAESGGIFRDAMLSPVRVLLVDRDNPPTIIRRRLRGWGVERADNLHVLTREHAPPLQDRKAWESFPADRYDVVIIDSLGSATEGISEKEGRETQQVLATLKDLAQKGPSILCLDNTNKAGLSYRGRGEKADAVGVLYEVRDITGWTPENTDVWWEGLPEAGDHAWASRASRRHGQTRLRLAFIPSKFRLGIEPQPFAIELDLTRPPYTLSDITDTLTEQAKETAAAKREALQRQLDHAAKALVAELRKYSDDKPMLKTAAEDFLMTQQLTRKVARNLLNDGGKDIYWVLQTIPNAKGNPIGVYPAGGKYGGTNNQGASTPARDKDERGTDFGHPHDTLWQKSSHAENRTYTAPDEHNISATQQISQWQKSAYELSSNGAGLQTPLLFAPSHSFLQGDDEHRAPIEQEEWEEGVL